MNRVATDPVGKQPSSRSLDALIYPAIYLTTIGVLLADFYTPLGFAVWVLYLIPVALTLWIWQPRVPLLIAAVVTVLMITAFFTDDPGMSRIVAAVNRSVGIATIWIMAGVGYFFIHNKIAVRKQQRLQAARTGLSEVMVGDPALERLGDVVLRFLAEFLDAQAAAVFVRDGGEYRLIATYGADRAGTLPSFTVGDGILGQAAQHRRQFLLTDVPEGHLTVSSAFSRGKPRHLLVAPMESDNVVRGVLELGFQQRPDADAAEIVALVSESVGVAIQSAEYRLHLQNLLEETQRQAEELQTQSEELRVSNEELEEQGRALRESQTRLELQQTELEQTNSQLEEQTVLLESQRDDLAKAHSAMEHKARELDQAGRYKSNFLANMSHELRTPLNSSLILAKLLADNPQGNLTEEQVKFARTILGAGNDLLTLINDILDLSKIEAGRVEVQPEPMPLATLVGDLTAVFQPIADEKKLAFSCSVEALCPETIETDRLRIEQILKNLLANAFKFTERGEVSLTIRPSADERIEFAVTDSGIGISEAQRQAIFEPFRQAESSTQRKYGGTGLGLSISRELARLLGGEIRLISEVGRGTTFTLSLPRTYSAANIREREVPTFTPPVAAASHRDIPAVLPPLRSTLRIEDDRARLTGERRVILVVEDDEPFARILADLIHELNFQCLIAATAEEAIVVATQFRPSAVILDLGLPDHSGLSVLDRLKHDARTRHIPVHVVSASDSSASALSLGAVGYLLKPVKREELIEVFQKLEIKLATGLRRVLIVEDDEVQRDAMRQLLGSEIVETVGVGTATDCLARLKESTFDCMVLDLSLPDATGFALLETLSREDAYSFPPVIVYTGRDLSSEEEQLLRQYSKSVIIKGAKSPERLLDEVTLFLHQVVTELPAAQQKMIEAARSRDAALEGRRILIVEDDVRNVFALTSILEPRGAVLQIARNGREAWEALERSMSEPAEKIDLILMDVMMPEVDGLTAVREIRQRPEWKKLPIIMLTAKAMKDDQDSCLSAGANDYMAKPLNVDKLLSLVRVWMPR